MTDDCIAAALARAQAKFPPITKGRKAKVPTKTGGEYSYDYADIGDVLTAVRPVLAAEGIAVVQATEDSEHGYLLVTKLLWRDQSIEGRMPLPIENAGPQQVGSLLTYYRRYGLTALIGVAAEDDDDGRSAQEHVKHGPRRAKPAAPVDEHLAEFNRLTAELELSAAKDKAGFVASTVGREAKWSTLDDMEKSTVVTMLERVIAGPYTLGRDNAGRPYAVPDSEPFDVDGVAVDAPSGAELADRVAQVKADVAAAKKAKP